MKPKKKKEKGRTEYRLKNEDIRAYNGGEPTEFPKYTSQLINWANQNAQGTRPKVVGQMSELFPEFQNSGEKVTLENWERWYLERHPDAVETATDKIDSQIKKLRKAIKLIDRDMVEAWVRDLLISKTYDGLYVQGAILAALAKKWGEKFRLADPEEEAVGIDGFVGGTPFSVKPESYKTMGRLSERIEVKMIYYKKTKQGLTFWVEE